MTLVVCLFVFFFFNQVVLYFPLPMLEFQKMKTKSIKMFSDKKKRKTLHESHMITRILLCFRMFFIFGCLSARLIERCWVLEMAKSSCTYSP